MNLIDPISAHILNNSGTHGPVTLMYHSIHRKNRNKWPWAISMSQFCKQLDILISKGWTTSTINCISKPDYKPKEKTVIITFDDGYVDNLYAFEELKKRQMKATWFIVSKYIGTTPEWEKDNRPNDRLLNSSELKQMASEGMEIGSHGARHVRLTELDSTNLKLELTESKARIEEILGNSVCSFAYPYGAWNQNCKQEVIKAGYSAACTTNPGWTLLDNDIHQLRRITIYNGDSISEFARKIAFAENEFSWGKTLSYYYDQIRKKLCPI